MNTRPRARTPAWRLASGLMPTVSISRPSAVRRVSSAASDEEHGADEDRDRDARATNPVPRNLNGALVTVRIWPSVISIAMPRPAVIRISVAMIGWIPRTATRKPFHRPSTRRQSQRGHDADGDRPHRVRVGEPRMIEHATAPAIAQIEPTDRSIPRVAMTRVMPTRDDAGSGRRCAGCRSGSRRGARRWRVIERKSGTATTLTTSNATSMATGQNRRLRDARVRAAHDVAPALRVGLAILGDQRQQVIDGEVLVGQVGDLAPVAQDHDPVAEAQHLLEFGGDEQHAHPVLGEADDQFLDLGLRADVDAAGGFVEDQQLAARWPASGPAAPSAGCRRDRFLTSASALGGGC